MEAPAQVAPMGFNVKDNDEPIREWDGEPGCSLLKCCGDCSCDCDQGWGLCCLTYWCTCLTFGLNSRDLFKKHAGKQTLIFFLLLVLPGLVYWGVSQSRVQERNVCVGYAVGKLSGRRQAHGYNTADNVAYLEEIKACQNIPVFTPLVIAFLCINWAFLIVGVAYVAVHRVAARRKLRIRQCCGASGDNYCGEWCLLFWCMSCALCQERRTLHKFRVRDGVVGADYPAATALGQPMYPAPGPTYKQQPADYQVPVTQPPTGAPFSKGADSHV